MNYSFASDNNAGVNDGVLAALRLVSAPAGSYGEDPFTEKTGKLFRSRFERARGASW
jgi:threonine aldolase